MFGNIIFNVLLFVMSTHFTNGVHEIDSSLQDFKNDNKGKLKFLRKKCPCGREKLWDMTMFYFDSQDMEAVRPHQRYLLSQRALGTGEFSKVYHAILITDKNKVADKCVAVKIPMSAKNVERESEEIMEKKSREDIRNNSKVEKEAMALKDLSNPTNQHIITMNEILSNVSNKKAKLRKIAIVLELGEMDLNAYLTKIKVDDDKLLSIVKQILPGLTEVHRAGYVYFNMKPENVLVMPHPDANREMHQIDMKLIDFTGAVKVYEHGKFVDKRAEFEPDWLDIFKAPEIMNPSKAIMITQPSDVWSLGISILSLLVKSPQFIPELNDNVYREAYQEEDDSLKKFNDLVLSTTTDHRAIEFLNKPLKIDEAGTSDSDDEVNKQVVRRLQKDARKFETLKYIHGTPDDNETPENKAKEIPDDLMKLESAFGWNLKEGPLLEMPIHAIGFQIKLDKVIRIMARNVIAKKEASSYPLIAMLLPILEEQFPKSMEIVKQCLKMEPNERPTTEDLLRKIGTIFKDKSDAPSSSGIAAANSGEYSPKDEPSSSGAAAAANSGENSPFNSTPFETPSNQSPSNATPTNNSRGRIRSMIHKLGKSVWKNFTLKNH